MTRLLNPETSKLFVLPNALVIVTTPAAETLMLSLPAVPSSTAVALLADALSK